MATEPFFPALSEHILRLCLRKKFAQCRDVACSVSMQYKIPPKVLEIKYSPSQIISLHFSIIRNNFAIKAFKDITIHFNIVYIGFKVLERAFKVLERTFKVLERVFKVLERAFKVLERAFNVLKTESIVY